ncbi:toll-like receptor 13 [Centropristis striata]|uniref:toll-like receptor 13 n=1 Tax=Centropristis striata TaxID=184440 RepID=UPI0027E1DEEB|nr:toll-like receptor 13 [Centropristis striata]
MRNQLFQHRFLFLLSVMLPVNLLLAYSLKNCSVSYSNNVTRVECSGRDLAAVPHDVPKDAVSLNLGSNHILKIKRTDLSRLLKLEYLQIGNNWILRIDDGAFADLELKQLDLSSNSIRNLTDNMFQGLGKLTNLSLERNQISDISPLAFRSLISLEQLILTNNHLHRMTDLVPILQLPNLNNLILDFNKFVSFQTDDLPLNKSNLRMLSMFGGRLTKFSITRDVFPRLQSVSLTAVDGFEWDVPEPEFLRSLNTLRLNESDVSCGTYREMLTSLRSVKELSLSFVKNQRDRHLVSIACQTPALTSLDLSGNYFVSINRTLLLSCSQLTDLDLSNNHLEELEELSLRSMMKLRRLDLRENWLSRVPLGVGGVSTLKILDLSVNAISALGCSDFRKLTRLEKLFLNHNRIATLKGCVFRNLNELKVLNVGENGVHTLTDFFKVNLKKLKVLDLTRNTLKHIKTGDFRNLHSLRSLYLESNTFYVTQKRAFEGLNSLKTLVVTPFFYNMSYRGIFRELHQLKRLKLHLTSSSSYKCSLQKTETQFSVFPLPFLKSLQIKSYDWRHEISPDFLNGLKSLEDFAAEKFFVESPHRDSFKYTPHLTSLQITQSKLQDFNPELFQPIPNLQTLNISNNKLRSLDFLRQVKLSALTRLTLRDNEITVIDESVFQSLPALTYLDLSGNPFTCDCSNAGFIQWAKNNNQTLVDNGHQYDCAFPAAQRGRKLLDFDVQSCWTDYGFLCFVSSTCLTLLTLLTSFTYHFLRWQLAYTFHLFLAFLYDSRKRKKGAAHQYDAFISYNVHDEAWVYREMLPVLEGEQGWRLCLHHRDFQPGKPIVENITDAIYGSRKTICVISRRYLQSEWCSREIQMASFRLFDEQKDVLILLFLEDIPARQLSPYHRMRKLVKRRTYLSWPLAGRHTGVFWQNVQRALETGDAPTETPNLLAPVQL